MGCTAIAEYNGYCTRHKPKEQPYSHPHSGMYASRKWRELRKSILLDRVTCAVCGDEASEVDHIVPHRGDNNLFWNVDNMQVLCKSCHSKKTAQEVNTRKNNKKQ